MIYWDDTANKVTTTAVGNKHFGYTLPDQGASVDDDVIDVIFKPNRAGG